MRDQGFYGHRLKSDWAEDVISLLSQLLIEVSIIGAISKLALLVKEIYNVNRAGLEPAPTKKCITRVLNISLLLNKTKSPRIHEGFLDSTEIDYITGSGGGKTAPSGDATGTGNGLTGS